MDKLLAIELKDLLERKELLDHWQQEDIDALIELLNETIERYCSAKELDKIVI